jgi:hypothetical protein
MDYLEQDEIMTKEKTMVAIMLIALMGMVGTTQPAVYGQKATITAPPGSRLNSVTVTVLHRTPLSGTWNFVGNNLAGVITFGTDPVRYDHSEPEFGFAGIFRGVPVAGTYDYEAGLVPIGQRGSGMLNLEYSYHNRDVTVFGNLEFMGSHHMKLTEIADYYTHHSNYVLGSGNPDTCCRAVTGLYLHQNDTIQFSRAYTHVLNTTWTDRQ